MQAAKTLKEIFTSGLEQLGFAWWIEIVTTQPHCTYYFGPFTSGEEAELAQAGYVEDIEQEGAQGVCVQVKWCKPRELTVFED
jgi:hypothetical protein